MQILPGQAVSPASPGMALASTVAQTPSLQKRQSVRRKQEAVQRTSAREQSNAASREVVKPMAFLQALAAAATPRERLLAFWNSARGRRIRARRARDAYRHAAKLAASKPGSKSGGSHLAKRFV